MPIWRPRATLPGAIATGEEPGVALMPELMLTDLIERRMTAEMSAAGIIVPQKAMA